VVASLYFATFSGITASNDGSHYALVRAIVSNRSFEISPYLSFAEDQDYASGPTGRYSDRPPGTALWTVPFFAAARFLPGPLVDLPSKHDRGNPRLLGIGAAVALAGAAAVGVFWLLVRQCFGVSLFAADVAALALAFGTATWKYSSVLYSHALSALLVLLSLYLAFRITSPLPLGDGQGEGVPGRRGGIRALPLLLGLVLGGAVVVEYTNALLAPIVGLYVLAVRRRPLDALWLVLGAVPPLAFLAWYDWLNFGCMSCVSTFQVDLQRWPNAAGMGASFATPLRDGLVGMLLWGNDNQGIFLLSPIAWLSLLGVVPLLRRAPVRGGLVLGIFLLYLLLFSKSTNFNPLTNDGRYLTPFLALWLVPLGVFLDRALCDKSSDGRRLVVSLAVFGLLFLSARNAFMHIAFSWNYDLKYGDLLNMSTPLPNVTLLLRKVFPNAANVWWLWLLTLPPAIAFRALAPRLTR
jgi:putative effector of murein hydrolase LrgA (UPF0299 family)